MPTDNITVIAAGGASKILQTTDNTTYHTPAHQIVNAAGTATLVIAAEDAAHSSGDTGILSLVVRANTAAATGTSDGDYCALIVDTNGKLWTNAAVTSVIPGTAATNLAKAEDAAHSSSDVGVMALAVRAATCGDLSAGNTDGDYEPLQVDANGRLYVMCSLAATQTLATVTTVGTVTTVSTVTAVTTVSTVSSVTALVAITTSVTPGTSAAHLGKAEDAAHSSGDTGVMVLGVRKATATDLSAGNTDGDYEPFQVDASGAVWTHVNAITAGETHIGEIAEPRATITITPTIDTNIFATGDAVGGKQTLTSMARVSGGVVVLESVVIRDLANQAAACDILFFDSDPSAATITNNAAFVFSTAITKLVGIVHVATTDWIVVDSIAIATLKNIGLTIKASGSAHLYAAVVGTGTPTYSGTTDLVFKYLFKQS